MLYRLGIRSRNHILKSKFALPIILVCQQCGYHLNGFSEELVLQPLLLAMLIIKSATTMTNLLILSKEDISVNY